MESPDVTRGIVTAGGVTESSMTSARRDGPTGGDARARPRLLSALTGLLFVPSWFLTAAHTSGELVGGRSAGWQAFVFALSPLFGNDMGGSLPLRAWMVASALSNVLLVATVVLAAWRPAAVGRRVAGALAIATLLNAYWFFLADMRDALRLGYYLWLAAFAVGTLTASTVVRGRSAERSPTGPAPG